MWTRHDWLAPRVSTWGCASRSIVLSPVHIVGGGRRFRISRISGDVTFVFAEHRVGARGPGQGGKRKIHAANGRGADVRHAPEAHGKHIAPARCVEVGQGPVQVSGVVGGQGDGWAADRVPRHEFLSGRRLTAPVRDPASSYRYCYGRRRCKSRRKININNNIRISTEIRD